MSVFFAGREIITPTTASVINDDAMQNQNLAVGNNLALIGRATGGQPKTVLSFGDPDQAKKVLRSGELLDAVLKAFSPSAQTGGPTTVHAVRVAGGVVRSSLDLKDATTATVATVTALNYGAEDNKIKIKIEAGSTSGKRISVQYKNETYSQDNVARQAFSVLYSGAQVSATISVTSTTVVLSAPAGTVVSTLQLSEFSTVGDLADKINTVAGFTATVLDGSSSKSTLNALDYVTAQSVITTAFVVRADLQAIIDYLSSGVNPLVTATRAAAVGTLPVNIPYTVLAGGGDGTVVNSDWSDCFTALQYANVQWLAPLSGDPAVHAMADAHAHFCSNILRRERRVICGTPAATTDANAIAAAKAINSDRTSLVHIGYYDYDSIGVLQLRAPYMTAALIAAAFSGVNPGTPLTNKTMTVRGLERSLRNPTDTDALIKGRVLCVENTDAGYKVVQSISTWLFDNKYNRVEQSCGAALDFTVRAVREAVDVLRGSKANPILLSRAASIAKSTLTELSRQEPQGPGVLAGDANSPAFRNITASIDGDVVRVQFECSPVIPANYILVTVYAVPYSGSVTV